MQGLAASASYCTELNSRSKSANPDLFKFYPKNPKSDLPLDIPPEFYSQLCSLLPQLPPNNVVKDLVHAHRDSSGKLIYSTPVQNRPWEWIENLGEAVLDDNLVKLPDSNIKNTGSLSLEHFAARPTADHILQSTVLPRGKDNSDQTNMRLEGDLRSFEDGITAESIYKRDWRETRLEAHRDVHAGNDGTNGEGIDDIGALTAPTGKARSGSRRPSPASSVRSRDSAHGSIASMRQSPGVGTKVSLSTVGEMTEEGDVDTAEIVVVGHKRKADDDVEMVEAGISDKARKVKGVKPRPKRKASAID